MPNQCSALITTLLSITLFTATPATGQMRCWPELQNELHSLYSRNDDYFGFSMAIDGETIIVSAPGLEEAYVMHALTGEVTHRLRPSDREQGDWFGASLAANDEYILIGAPSFDLPKTDSGLAYVDRVTGMELHVLRRIPSHRDDRFGEAVGLGAKLAVVGVPGFDNGERDSGALFVYDINNLLQNRMITQSDPTREDHLGKYLAVHGDKVIASAPGDRYGFGKDGRVYIFDLRTGEELVRIDPPNDPRLLRFGMSVGLSDSLAAVGAFDVDFRGMVYAFDPTTGELVREFRAFDSEAHDNYGQSLAIDGDVLIVGAPEKGQRSGAAYVYGVGKGDGNFKIEHPDTAPYDFHGSHVAIQGNLAFVAKHPHSDPGAVSVIDWTCPQLTVDPMPIRAGEMARFTLTNIIPNKRTWLMYSIKGLGRTRIRNLGVTLDLKQPIKAAHMKRAEPDGTAEWRIPVPDDTPRGITIWFQAFQHRNVTNYVETVIN